MFEVGEVVEGKVTGLTKFGAFISLPENKTGMVHISEVASSYVNDIKDFLKEGQSVKVKVIDIDRDGKIALSIKKAGEENSEERKHEPEKRKSSVPNTWQGTVQREEPQTFEDMMAQFKQRSDEKLADLKRATDSKRISYSRRK